MNLTSAITLLALPSLFVNVSCSDLPKPVLSRKTEVYTEKEQLRRARGTSKNVKAKRRRNMKKGKKGKKSKRINSAVFTMTNASDKNEIIMYTRDESTGELTYTGYPFSTGGVGGDPVLETGPDDPLASTGSLIVTGDCLLAVNAGSNTVRTFKINIRKKRIKRVSTLGSGGELPVSIAANEYGAVYVLNAGVGGSISGFNLNPTTCAMESIDGSTVSLGQFPVDNETVPEIPFFVSSPAQIGFTPDGTRLVVTIKGIRGNPLLGGTITEWVLDGTTGLITKGVQITTGSEVPFSFDFDDDDNLLVVNAFGNGEVGSGNAGSMSSYGMPRFGFLNSVNLNQTTSCWIEYSNGCAFTTNNGGNSISSLAVNDGEFSLIESIAAEVNNPIDEISSPDGRFLYVLSTGHTSGGQPSIYVYEIGSNCGLTETQVISDGIPSEVGTVFGAVGLAIF